MGKRGRPSKITEPMRVELGRRLAAGEKIRPLAREYGIAESTLREAFSAQAPEIRAIAERLAAAEADLVRLPPPAQKSARSLADQLKLVSTNLVIAANNGSKTLAILSEKAVRRAERAGDEPTEQELRSIAALSATGNEAAKPALELVKASKTIQREEEDEPTRQTPMAWTVKIVKAAK